MIEHISLRCRNAGASRTFYEQALAPLGYKMDRNYGDAFGFIQGDATISGSATAKWALRTTWRFMRTTRKRSTPFTELQSPLAGRTTVLLGHAKSTATRHSCSIPTGTTSRQ